MKISIPAACVSGITPEEDTSFTDSGNEAKLLGTTIEMTWNEHKQNIYVSADCTVLVSPDFVTIEA